MAPKESDSMQNRETGDGSTSILNKDRSIISFGRFNHSIDETDLHK